MIYPVALVAVFIIDHRVAEIVHVTTGLPGGWMHENRGINTHDILIELGHALPPMVLDIFFQFTPPLTIVIHGTKAVVDLT